MSYQPHVDILELSATNTEDKGKVTLHAASELMRHQQAASPIDPTDNLVLIQDGQSRPMAFTIGTDQRFRLVRSDPAVRGGWQVVELMKGIGDFDRAVTFDVTQDRAGRISVALALCPKGSDIPRIFTAFLLPPDAMNKPLEELAALFSPVTGLEDTFGTERVRLGLSDDDKAPMVVVTGTIGDQYLCRLVDPLDNTARPFDFPETVAKLEGKGRQEAILGISPGHALGQRGVFFLYRIGEGLTLECTTLPDAGMDTMYYDYSPGNQGLPESFRNLNYTCIALLTGSRTMADTLSSDIYVGTKTGIYLFRDAQVKNIVKVTDQVGEVDELNVVEDAENIAIWARCGQNRLYYISGRKGETYTWNAPLLFKTDAFHIAPMRSRARMANEVFVVNQDRSLTHFWQDPASTLWRRRTLRLPDQPNLVVAPAFMTHIHLENGDGNPISDQVLRVKSSTWSYVEANGLIYCLDPDHETEIPIDMEGNVTLIEPATGMAPPIYTVRSACFAGGIHIHSNGRMEEMLRAIRGGEDLKAATTQDGRPILDKHYDDATLNGVAANIQKLTERAGTLRKGQAVAGQLFVTIELGKGAPGPKPAVLSATVVPAVGGVAVANADPVTMVAGDVLHLMEEVVDGVVQTVSEGVTVLAEGVSFVLEKAEEGLRLVLNLADKVITVVLDTIEMVFKTLGWILKQIVEAIEKLIAWLGFIFNWDDIWKTHKVMAAVTENFLSFVAQKADMGLEELKDVADGFFDMVRDEIKNVVIPEEFRGVVPGRQAAPAQGGPPPATMSAPAVRHTFYQIRHGGMLAGGSPTTHADPITTFIDQVVMPVGREIIDRLGDNLDNLIAVLTKGTVEDIFKLAGSMIDLVIEPLKKLVRGFLNVLQSIIQCLKDLICSPLDIPLLSALYKFVTGLLKEEEELTVVNATTLMLAIPTTILYKISTNEAPFGDGCGGMDQPDLFERLLHPDQLAANTATNDSTANSAGTANAAVAAGAATPAISSLLLTGASAPQNDAAPAASVIEFKNQAPFSYYIKFGGTLSSLMGSVSSTIGLTTDILEANVTAAAITKVRICLGLGAAALTFPLPKYGKPEHKASYQVAFILRSLTWLVGTGSTIACPFITVGAVSGGVNIGVAGLSLVTGTIVNINEEASFQSWIVTYLTNIGAILGGAGSISKAPPAGPVLSFLGGTLLWYGGIISFGDSVASRLGDASQLMAGSYH